MNFMGAPVWPLKNEHSIWVDQLEIKADEKYKTVWSRKQQQELYKGDGG
jgi:hypothetical protein